MQGDLGEADGEEGQCEEIAEGQGLGYPKVVGFRVFELSGLGCIFWGLGFPVWGLGSRVWGLGFEVWGLGSRA